VVDEDHRSFGLSGGIAAVVAEHDPTLLKAPLRRVAVLAAPYPRARTTGSCALRSCQRFRIAGSCA